MPLISTVFALFVVGVLLWLVNSYIPMGLSTKRILNILVVLAVAIWLLYDFGVLGHGGEVRLPDIK